VGIAAAIGVTVVASVVGDPADERTLERHRSEHREDDLEWASGFEAAVREERWNPIVTPCAMTK
jgi:hypothetical protein